MKKEGWILDEDGRDIKFIAKTFKGFEVLLDKELMTLGARETRILNRAVEFKGDMGFLYKSCLSLHTALKILMPIAYFEAKDPEQLYKKAVQLPWSKLFSKGTTFAIQFTVHSELFPHSQFAALKLKDAIVDNLRKKLGTRPDVDKFNPDVQIDLMIANDEIFLSLDASGAPLFKRGYRKDTGKAPLNEVLAAGLIQFSGWNGYQPLYDPFCGSGTLLIEACLQHMDIPPGIFRESFGFQKWANYDPNLFDMIREGRLDRVKEPQVEFFGSDKDRYALNKAVSNLKTAELGDIISVYEADFFKDEVPDGEPGVIVMNPPYGKKLDIDSEDYFSRIGDKLKQSYSGWKAWVILPEEVKSIGLRPYKKIPVLNGDIPCKWSGFDLFEGSKKRGRETRNYKR